MPRRLKTPWTHKIITSPLGALMDNKFFEWLKTRGLAGEFRLQRAAAAAARVAHEDADVDAFLHQMGAPAAAINDLSAKQRRRIAEGLDRFKQDWRARQVAIERWEEGFWAEDGNALGNDQLVALEEERRTRSARCFQPTASFGFLAKADFVPMVKSEVPTPDAVFAQWAEELADPRRIYGPAPAQPTVERSRQVLGPGGVEYLVRFASPSPLFNDTAYARVLEPEDAGGETPTLIYGSGLAMAYDQIVYWPEEAYMGRPLSTRGYRVILPESPWHGRRRPLGWYSGERYLATAPVGLFQLYAAQAQETALLIEWARALGSPAVAVGGFSLGGIVAQQVAGHCASWPAAQRPDVIFIGASGSHIDQVVLQSTIAKELGVAEAIQAAGWTPQQLKELRPLLDPPPQPGLPPERITAVLGRRDTYVPYRWGMGMLEAWHVPDENIVTWDLGHFSALVRLFRTFDAQELIMRRLDEASASEQMVT